MLFITLQSLPSFLVFQPGSLLPRLKPRQVPLARWTIQVLVFTFGSLFNNWAFAFRVPLTVQIVFRSAGKCGSFVEALEKQCVRERCVEYSPLS